MCHLMGFINVVVGYNCSIGFVTSLTIAIITDLYKKKKTIFLQMRVFS